MTRGTADDLALIGSAVEIEAGVQFTKCWIRGLTRRAQIADRVVYTRKK